MFTFVSQNKQIYLMIEKIAQFNAKMEEFGLDPNDFFVISFWRNSPIHLQGYFNEILARKLHALGFDGILNKTTGYFNFKGHGLDITLS